jgi:hypothetical protein
MTKDLPGMRGRTEADFGPQFMAPLVCFLASDKAAHITGQTFGVNANHTYIYKMMTSQGIDPMSAEPWDPAALEGAIDRIVNW